MTRRAPALAPEDRRAALVEVTLPLVLEHGRAVTTAQIADKLNAQGIEGKRGGRWYASTVRYLIQRQAA